MFFLEPVNIAKLLNRFNNFLVLGHKNPDGDCIGSMAAFSLFATALGKSSVAWIGELPTKYDFLAPYFVNLFPEKAKFDLVVCLDTPCRSRLEVSTALLPTDIPYLCIDHHPVVQDDFDYIINDTSQAAAACIVLDIIKATGCQISPVMATAIYTAILTDTGSFSNRNTNLEVFKRATEVVEAGADPAEIANKIYNSVSATQLKVLGVALDSLQLLDHGKIALMSLSASDKIKLGASSSDTEDLVNYARSVSGVRVAAVLVEDDFSESTKISLRSKNVYDDISLLAKQFNGGGHKCAAGATVNESLASFRPKFHEALLSFSNSLIEV